MKGNNKKTGNRGEDLAVEFLENKNYLVVERNFRTRFGEIDIVCLDGEILVFVEVKTKIGHDFGEPEEMVNKSKLAQVQRMGEVFITTKTQNIQNLKKQSNVMPDLIRHPENHLDSGSVPGMTSWNGQCRVDVVGIVLNEDLSVERIRHFEAVY